MTFASLAEHISKEYRVTILTRGENLEMEDVTFLDHRFDYTRRNTLYFGYDRQLKELSHYPILCILAQTEESLVSIPTGCNAILVSPDSLFSIFNDAKTLIEAQSTKGLFEELTRVADRTHNLEAVIDAACVRLGSSLLFCDMNYKIVACSSTFPVLDPLWIENTAKGYCSYDFISSVKELFSNHTTSETTSAVEVSCPQSPYKKLTCKVYHNQAQVGFLLAIEGENHVPLSHFEMLSTISHVISYTIAYYTPDLFVENSLYHELLYDMLIGAPAKEIAPRLLNMHFPPKMQVLFIRPTRYMGSQYLNQIISKKMKHVLQGTHTTYHKKGIVAIVPLKEHAEAEVELYDFLMELCQKEHIRIGISNPFDSIHNFVRFFEQAYTALEIGQKLCPDEIINRYLDYQIFDMFSQVNSPEQLGRYCHPALTSLRLYDHKNGSELYKTLCVFIENKCNIKLTSESLYIHRNSLVYRLNRITQLCNLNYSDVNTLFLLRLSFLIDRFNELNTNREWS